MSTPFGLQIVGYLLHVVDFERDHAIPEMLVLWSRVDGSALVRDQLDDGTTQIQVYEVQGTPRPERSIRSRDFTVNPSTSV